MHPVRIRGEHCLVLTEKLNRIDSFQLIWFGYFYKWFGLVIVIRFLVFGLVQKILKLANQITDQLFVYFIFLGYNM